MAVKKKKSSKGKAGKPDVKRKKKRTKAEDDEEPRVTRKSYVLDLVEGAGSKGISVAALVEKTDDQFDYGEGKTSRMRVNNTIKEAVEDGLVRVKDGLVTWKK